VIPFLKSQDSDEPVLVLRYGMIGTVQINRPGSGNAIDDEIRRGVLSGIEELGRTNEIRAIVLTGVGDVFSIGGDVTQLATLTANEAEELARLHVKMLDALRHCQKPLIAAIRGPCFGIGFEIALQADIRFARSDARFGLPGINLGITPAGATISRLSRLLGSGPATALLMTGSVIDAERALALGLVTNVASPEDFDSSMEQLAGHMAALSPVAVAELKRLIDLADAGRMEEAETAGIRAFVRCYRDGDAVQRWTQMLGGRVRSGNLH
jgi:enoyl-CoA hydratase